MTSKAISEMDKARASEERLREKFERAAIGASKMFAMSMHDLKGAYQSKKESLTTIFDAAKTARSDRNGWIGWSVFWAITITPIAAYTLYKAWESHSDYRDLKQEVKREVESFRNEATAVETPAVPQPKGPFTTRIHKPTAQ